MLLLLETQLRPGLVESWALVCREIDCPEEERGEREGDWIEEDKVVEEECFPESLEDGDDCDGNERMETVEPLREEEEGHGAEGEGECLSSST